MTRDIRTLQTVGKATRYVGAVILMLIILIPFLWMISTSLSSVKAAYSLPPKWIPRHLNWEHYLYVLTVQNVFQYFLNSVEISVSITVGQLAFCSMAAYAFARLTFPGQKVLFALIISSLMIPLQVTIVPVFILMKWLHLLNTRGSLILPALSSAFGVFFLRQFFLTVPRELSESAKIDGAGNFTIFSRIFLPVSTAALSALAVFTFLYFWNELLRPLIFLDSQSKKTLPLFILLLRSMNGGGDATEVMAGAAIAILPIFVVFLFAQRYIVEGIVMTGIKG